MKLEYNGQIINVQNYRIKGQWAILRFGSYEMRLPLEVLDGVYS